SHKDQSIRNCRNLPDSWWGLERKTDWLKHRPVSGLAHWPDPPIAALHNSKAPEFSQSWDHRSSGQSEYLQASGRSHRSIRWSVTRMAYKYSDSTSARSLGPHPHSRCPAGSRFAENSVTAVV